MTTANAVRGEVDLELGGHRFVLRPTWEAGLEIEQLTGKALMQLVDLCSDGKLSNGDAATATTVLIKAWGREVGDNIAANVDRDRIAQLIHEFGIAGVMMRLLMVLGMAVTGGCKADGTLKEGEAFPTPEMMTATPGVGSKVSRQSASAGRQGSSGGPRRTSSGRGSKSGRR